MFESRSKILFYTQEDFKNLIKELLDVITFDWQMDQPQNTEEWLKKWLEREINSLMDYKKVDGILIDNQPFKTGKEIVNWLWMDKEFINTLMQEVYNDLSISR